MLHRRHFLYSSVAFLAGCRKKKGAGFPGYAFVANEEGRAVAAVDLTIFAVAKHIPLYGSPCAVLAHAARDSVYALVPQAGLVQEIEAATLAARRKVQAGTRAVSMRFSRDGRSLWVLCQEPRQLVRLALDSLKVDAVVPLPALPATFDRSPGGEFAAVSFAAEGAVGLVDLDALRAHQPVRLGDAVSAVQFRSDGKQLLAGVTGRPSLAVMDVPGSRIIVRLPLPVEPQNLCYKQDGGQLFLTGKGMDAVVVVYPYTTEVAETVLAGHAPGAMAASENPDYLFVANPASGDVTILNMATRRAIARASVGAEPGCIAITPDNQYALVLNRRSGDMAVIRIPAITARRTRSAALFTVIPVGSKPVSAAII